MSEVEIKDIDLDKLNKEILNEDFAEKVKKSQALLNESKALAEKIIKKEQKELNKQIKKLDLKEKLALVDEEIKDRIHLTPVKTGDISSFTVPVEYSYSEIKKILENGESKEKEFVTNRSFYISFKFLFENKDENEKIYALKIRNLWFVKADLLSLYFAFQEQISKKFKFWIEKKKGTRKKRRARKTTCFIF